MTAPSRARLAGTASVAALVLAVAVAFALDPTVRLLPVRARLSDLGRPGAPGALVLDIGLLLAGVLGLVAVRSWLRAATEPLDRAAAALAGVAFLGLGVAGVFPAPSAAHTPFLAAAYLAGWTAPLLDTVRRRRDGGGGTRRSRAIVALVAGLALVALLWIARALVATTFVLSDPTSALLLPELATLALFGGWVLLRVRGDALTGRRARPDPGVTAGGP